MIELPETELREALARGYRLKIFAREGSGVLIVIPHGMIERLFTKLDNPEPKV